MLSPLNPSSTSNTKYYPLRRLVAEIVGVDAADIYPTTVGPGKNFDVRVEQSAAGRNSPIAIGVLSDASYLQVWKAERRVADGSKRAVIFFAPVDGTWRLIHVVEAAGSGIGARLAAKDPQLGITAVNPSTTTPTPVSDVEFTQETFDLLAGLDADPTQTFVQSHAEDLKRHVVDPFQRMFDGVIARLPSSITSVMTTGGPREIYSRFPKNDWGRGGAWSHYWGAIFVGSSRRVGVQLFSLINKERLQFGFAIGVEARQYEDTFFANLEAGGQDLLWLLADALSEANLSYRRRDDGTATLVGWDAWYSAPLQHDPWVARVIDRNEVVGRPHLALADDAAKVFEAVFPFVLLATERDPMPPISSYLERGADRPVIASEYPLAQLVEETALDQSLLVRWLAAIERRRQAIVYGPPGTGKTFVAKRLARHIVAGTDGFTETVQFHPAYSYEDFIQGIRPIPRPGGGLDYPLVAGRFLEFCREAARRSGPCVLLIDEFNRANVARVFGELMYLLEYRDETMTGGDQERIPLSGGGEFGVPHNVRIIGTMNTADRSIALVDYALRRRFAFLELRPQFSVLTEYHRQTGFPVDRLVDLLRDVNAEIRDPHYEVGISFFLRDDLDTTLADIWDTEIVPYLEEYFIDRPEIAERYRWAVLESRFA